MLRRLPAPLVNAGRLLTATGWTTLLAGVALTALAVRWRHGEMAIVGGALLASVIIASTWMVRSVALSGRRAVEPARLTEGDTANAVLTVRNEGHGNSPPVVAVDHVNGRPISLTVPSIGPGGSREERYPVPAESRGVYELGPLTVAHSDPFRMVRAGSGIGGQTRYRVWPKTTEVAPLPTGRIRDVEGSATPRTAGSGVTFHTLREYVPGDDRRHVHWRSTAKTGDLVVRQHVQTSEPKMFVFLDCRVEAYDGVSRFDHACRIAASLVRAAVRWSNPVELMTSDGATVVVDSSGANYEVALDGLADAALSSSDHGMVQLVLGTQRRHRSSSAAVITGEVGGREAEVVRAMQGRYASFTAIQVGDLGAISGLPLPPSSLFLVTDTEDFTRQWRRRFGL